MSKALAKKDSQGRFTRDLGWKLTDDGKVVQHRFLLGKDEARADKLVTRLGLVWKAVEERWERTGRPTLKPLWDRLTLKIGSAVAKDVELVEVYAYELPPVGVPARAGETTEDHYRREVKALSESVLSLQRDFPFVTLKLVDTDFAADGLEEVRKEQTRLTRLLSQDRASGTLYQALTAWSLEQAGKYTATEHGKLQAMRASFLKRLTPDVPLSELGKAQIDAVLDRIKNRPVTKRGEPASADYCKHLLKVWRAFLDWLEDSAFAWKKPTGYKVKGVRLNRLAQDSARKRRPVSYSRDELVTLYTHATPLERVFLLLGLNCAFGAAEIATLQAEEVVERSEMCPRLAGPSVCRDRTKTGCYGEWVLWPETVQALRWYAKTHGEVKAGALIRPAGQPLGLTGGGNRSRYVPNRWAALVKRVRKDHPEFVAKSFGKLRKTGPRYARRKAGGETASLYLAHGQLTPDRELDRYAERAYARLHRVILRFRRFLRPMFDAVQDPFPAKASRPSTPPSVIRRVQQMRRDGLPYKTIREKTGLSFDTIRRYTAGKPS